MKNESKCNTCGSTQVRTAITMTSEVGKELVIVECAACESLSLLFEEENQGNKDMNQQEMKIPGYKRVAYIECSDGTGIQILAAAPNREFTGPELAEFSCVADKLCRFMHKETDRIDPEKIAARNDQKSKLIAVFPEPIYVEEIPNEYNKDRNDPWLMVATKVGHIKIGWRKRVINIDYSHTTKKTKAEELFPEEKQTTRYDQCIHAWSYEDAKKYIEKIME